MSTDNNLIVLSDDDGCLSDDAPDIVHHPFGHPAASARSGATPNEPAAAGDDAPTRPELGRTERIALGLSEVGRLRTQGLVRA
jgi:hypothetical protein